MLAAAMAMMMAAWMAAKMVEERASSEVGMRAPPSVGKPVKKKDNMSGYLMEWTKVFCSVDKKVKWKDHFSADEMVGPMGSSQVARSVAQRAARTVAYVVAH